MEDDPVDGPRFVLEGLDRISPSGHHVEARGKGDAEVVEVVALDLARRPQEFRLPRDLYFFEADFGLGDDIAAEDGGHNLHPGADPEDRLIKVLDPSEEVDLFGKEVVLEGRAAEDDPIGPVDQPVLQLSEVDDLVLGAGLPHDGGDRIDELVLREGLCLVAEVDDEDHLSTSLASSMMRWPR